MQRNEFLEIRDEVFLQNDVAFMTIAILKCLDFIGLFSLEYV